MDEREQQIGKQSDKGDSADDNVEIHDRRVPLKPGAGIGKAIDRGKGEQQPREVGDVEHLSFPNG
jgi:hypothetical protein